MIYSLLLVEDRYKYYKSNKSINGLYYRKNKSKLGSHMVLVTAFTPLC